MAQAGTLLRYVEPSALTSGESGRLDLRTWTPDGGAGVAPHFFRGFVERADLVAMGIVAVAKVAGSRYYGVFSAAKRAAMADPVVTADGERLRFESFSACCGVHARLDVDPDGLDGTFTTGGTTNVDVNAPLRSALARVLRCAPLQLSVGDDELVVDTLAGQFVERKVDLPDRWIKGFAETQVAQSRMVPVFELSATDAQRLMRSMPSTSREPIRIEAHGSSWRLVHRPSGDHVTLVGPERLEAVLPLVPSITGLRVFRTPGDAQPAASAWEFNVEVGRLTLTVSPEPLRGFSGEGGLLASFADTDDANELAVDEALASHPLWSIHELSTKLGSDAQRIAEAVDVLAASGRVGYDLHRRAYFRRVLPLGTHSLDVLNPRLGSSTALLAADAVTFDEAGRRATVRSGGHHHVVNLVDNSIHGARCTCPWYAKHRGGRGPCKHVLAAVRAARRATP